MTDYILLIVSAALFSLMFLFNRGYQRSRGEGLDSVLSFSVYSNLFIVIILLILCLIGALSGWRGIFADFNLEFSVFSLLVSILGAAVGIGGAYFSIKALESANLSLYSIFAMLGGMLLPSVCGIAFYGEPLTLPKLACYLLIVVSVALTFEKGKQSKKAIFCYFGVFVLNGMSGVVAQIHQGTPGVTAVNSNSFMIIKGALTVAFCFIWFMIKYKGVPTLKLRECSGLTGYAACCGLGNLFVLIALLNLDASVQYPIITGGTMFFSTVVSLIIGEKPSARTLIAAVVAAASSVLMML